jgi:hypothetical protein
MKTTTLAYFLSETFPTCSYRVLLCPKIVIIIHQFIWCSPLSNLIGVHYPLVSDAECANPCECVTWNEKDECIEEETEHCCNIEYDPSCKAGKDNANTETEKEIEEVSDKLETFKKEHEQLTDKLVELDEAALHPSEKGAE